MNNLKLYEIIQIIYIKKDQIKPCLPVVILGYHQHLIVDLTYRLDLCYCDLYFQLDFHSVAATTGNFKTYNSFNFL